MKWTSVKKVGASLMGKMGASSAVLFAVLFTLSVGVFLPAQAAPLAGQGSAPSIAYEERVVSAWREKRDQFFKSHVRSPLPPEIRKRFKGLSYYPFNPEYVFSGKIERYIFHIENPKYYATFLTNKGTHKRYVRYGKFRFELDGRGLAIEIYKSILGDTLFIPFKDGTNGRETYEGGRYVDAEILVGYGMTLDFNMAYAPSCAYDSRFICALPPRENDLAVKIEAGEKNLKAVEPPDRSPKRGG